jgi:hypothetical protein
MKKYAMRSLTASEYLLISSTLCAITSYVTACVYNKTLVRVDISKINMWAFAARGGYGQRSPGVVVST